MSIEIPKPTNLPTFPNFTLLKAHHQAEIIQAIKTASSPYSDYNFISLWSWDHQNQLQICLLNGNLVIRFQDYLDPTDFFYSFIGNQQVDETAMTLLHNLDEGMAPELRLIPDFVIENLERPADFLITEDRDSFDYIIAVKDTVEAHGHETKRRMLNRFMREHEHDLAVRELDIAHPDTATQLLAVFERWQQQSNTPEDQKANELRAIQKLLASHADIQTDNLHVLGVYVGDDLSAFSVNEVLENNFGMGHFKKAVRDYKGLGVALDHFTAKNLLDKGVVHLNHEQDLGIEGLRQAKLASHPVYFLKKYNLALAV